MSNPIELVEATPLRDDDELEGTLLPATAYTVDNFEYDEATVARAQAQYQQEEQALQEAYPLDRNDRTALSDDSRTRVKYGERSGMIQQEAENEAIRRNNRKVYTHDYFERQGIAEANRRARAEDTFERMGRTPILTENRPSTTTIPPLTEKKDTVAPKESATSAGGYKMGGYEVKEYSIGSYECRDYKVSEYKSVYD